MNIDIQAIHGIYIFPTSMLDMFLSSIELCNLKPYIYDGFIMYLGLTSYCFCHIILDFKIPKVSSCCVNLWLMTVQALANLWFLF